MTMARGRRRLASTIAPPVESGATTFFNAVGPNYFATTGTRLIAGREFSAADANGAERVVIINESLAASAFGQQSPLGRRITIGRHADRRSLTIVGVVADATYQRLQEAPRAIAYLPHRQTTEALTGRPLFVVARVVQPSSEVTDALREALAGGNPIGSVRVEPLVNRIRDSLVTERILAVLAAGLAGCALLLACAGLFGLLMHLVARRTREIGVRMALGARTADVVRPVIGHALGLAAIGLGDRRVGGVGRRRRDSQRPPRHRAGRPDRLRRRRPAHAARLRRRRTAARAPRRPHQSDRSLADGVNEITRSSDLVI